jgi:cytochrome c peroxidase
MNHSNRIDMLIPPHCKLGPARASLSLLSCSLALRPGISGLRWLLLGLLMISSSRGATNGAKNIEAPQLVSRQAQESSIDPAAANLGKRLFFDPRLSGDATLSCASCHQPDNAWTDGQALSQGYPGTLYFRNVPTLLGASRNQYFYWDGRLSGDDLPTLVRDHLSEAHFMQADGRLLIERMRQIPVYQKEFRKVYGGEPTYGQILKAVATYVRTLDSGETPLDRFLDGDPKALSPAAKRGLKLFRGQAGCLTCHHGPRLTDGRFHSMGVPANQANMQEPLRHITFRRFFRTLGLADYNSLRHDAGLRAITKKPEDDGRFRTPSLREVGRTAPYMHNGTLATLEEVVAFYKRGADPLPGPLHLSKLEQKDLVAFLQSLSSEVIAVTPPEPAPYGLRQPLAPGYPATGPSATEPSAHLKNQPPHPDEYPALAILPPMPIPGDNPISPAKVELGRTLFFDDRLSGDVGTSCVSCHDPRLGWGDGNALSRGYAGTQHWRNSQTIINAAYLSKMFWAGEAPSAEAQAHSAITGNVAGNGDTMMIEERLKQIPFYVALFQKAFGTKPRYGLALKAIASFERTETIAVDSPFDEHLAGDPEALTEGALRGLELFQGKAHCIRCHNGPLLSDENYHALRVPNHPLFEEDPLRQITHRFQHYARGVPEDVYRNSDRDLGLYYTTKRPVDQDKFRTPPLRYLLYTAPYMHNGMFETLEEVIDFYDQGGGEGPNKSPLLEPLGLTEDEKMDLVELLESMSGDEVRIRAPVLPAYEVMKSPE